MNTFGFLPVTQTQLLIITAVAQCLHKVITTNAIIKHSILETCLYHLTPVEQKIVCKQMKEFLNHISWQRIDLCIRQSIN